MIYLIDDNQSNQRQKDYSIDFVETGIFQDVLTSIERIEKREKASDFSHLEFLNEAKCILMHVTTEDWDNEKGFLNGSTTNVEKILKDISDFGDKIPLVLFSNSMGNPVYSRKENPNFIREIKKNIFYENLFDFVDYYKNTGKIELRIIAYGKKFVAQEVKQLSQIMLDMVASNKNTEKFVITLLSGKQQIFKEFIELSFPNDNWIIFLNDLEDNPIIISEFRNKINLITESFLKYGKNICPWK